MPRWTEEGGRTEPTPRDGKGQRAFQGTTAISISLSLVSLIPGNTLGDCGPGGLGLNPHTCRSGLHHLHGLPSLSSPFPVQRWQTWVGIPNTSQRETGHCGHLLSAPSPRALYARSPGEPQPPCSLQVRVEVTQNREDLQLAQVTKLAPGLEATLEY